MWSNKASCAPSFVHRLREKNPFASEAPGQAVSSALSSCSACCQLQK